eukprot:scaffold2436_cov80-Skeletonema_dohrnii-CCMP3373.AAC.10
MKNYRLLSKKGEGVCAEVIKAENIKTGTFHAVKCMKKCYESVDQVSRQREIQALKRLSPHPNVVKLDEILFDPPTGRLALVFELMEGNLYEAIQNQSKDGPFSKDMVKDFMRQIFTALDYMHSKGVVHRDIKPANILVDKSGSRLKLADFGSCRRISGNLPFTDNVRGSKVSRWYRSPEMLLTCGMYGPEVDVWAAGCIMFELTTLNPLFPGKNEADQVTRIHRILGIPKTGVVAKLKQYAPTLVNFHFSRQEGIGLKKLLAGATADSLDLLQQALVYDKSDRISASEAMKHSYFVLSPGINNLSADLCCIIADFLPKTSRALLAVALTAPSASFRESDRKGQPTAVSKAIISSTKARMPFDSILDELCEEDRVEFETKGKHRAMKLWVDPEDHARLFRKSLSKQIKQYYDRQWEVMDFVDIPVSLASRLSDDDLGAILVCIDAKHKLKQLKLTHCTNIVGHGLEPLRGSTVVEKLDLGLVRQFEAPYLRKPSGGRNYEFLFDDSKLSEGPVCAIVDSILRGENDSLDRLQYPHKWSVNSSEPDALVTIYDSNVFGNGRMKQLVDEHDIIANKFACCLYFGYEDEKEFCSSLEGSHERLGSGLVDVCISCRGASFTVCSNCNGIVCYECGDIDECSDCNTRYCPLCRRDNDFDNAPTFCEAAGYGSDCPPRCSSCRLKSCREGTNACTECKVEVFDELRDECNIKQVQIDSQNDEMERLRSIIEQMTIQPDRFHFQAEETSNSDTPIFSVMDQGGEVTQYRLRSTTKMRKLFLAHASRRGVDVSDLRFILRGKAILPEDTPERLGLDSNDRIVVALLSSTD